MILKRVLVEKRSLLLPLAILLGANIALYAVAVYPLTIQVANAERRAETAAARAEAARAEEAAARGALEGKSHATVELERFYREVLPRNLAAARRATYARLAQLADDLGLQYERRTAAPEGVRGSALMRLGTTIVLSGEYRDMRQFIYRLETAPEFLVIDDIALQQVERLSLTLDISTYYWTGADAPQG